MRIVFMGSPTEVIAPLENLVELGTKSSHKLIGVVSQPPRPTGRKQIVTHPPVATWAMEHNIPVFQPENINSEDAVAFLRQWQPDVIITAAYGQILKEAILKLPRRAIINIHPSLLPTYRGAIPVPQALLDGCESTGVTILFTVKAVDAGNLIVQKAFSIGANECADALTARLFQEGGKLLMDALQLLENPDFEGVPQDASQVTHCRKIDKQDGLMSWDLPSAQIFRRFRAYFPWPGSFTFFEGKRLVVTEMTCLKSDGQGPRLQAGEFIYDRSRKMLVVGTGDEGLIGILTLVPAGSKPVDGAGFWNGLKLEGKGIFSV